MAKKKKSPKKKSGKRKTKKAAGKSRTAGAASRAGRKKTAKKAPARKKKTKKASGKPVRAARPASKKKPKKKSSKAASAPKAATRRKKTTTRRKPAPAPPSPSELFTRGLTLVQGGFLFDAIHAFRDAIAADAAGDLADDALFNIGLCSMTMSLHQDAIDAFTRVIEDYPGATIAQVGDAQEFGRTAAKAHLGRLRARLALGDVDGARADLAALESFGDSYVVEPDGRRVTFSELGRAAIEHHGLPAT